MDEKTTEVVRLTELLAEEEQHRLYVVGMIEYLVRSLREAGASWGVIADALDVSTQAVWARFREMTGDWDPAR